MRKLIAAFRMSLDGFIEGPKGEVDWVDTWDDTFDLMPQIDALVLGGGMYPDYEQYWSAVHADPQSSLPVTGRLASAGEIEYARFANATPHVVLSTTIETVSWKTTRIVRDIEEIRAMKEQPGKDIYAVGGAKLVEPDESGHRRRASARRASGRPRWGKGALQWCDGAAATAATQREVARTGSGSVDLRRQLSCPLAVGGGAHSAPPPFRVIGRSDASRRRRAQTAALSPTLRRLAAIAAASSSPSAGMKTSFRTSP